MTEVTQLLLWEACACTPIIGYGKEEWVNGIKREESGKWKRNPVKTPERTIEVSCRQKLFDPFLGAGLLVLAIVVLVVVFIVVPTAQNDKKQAEIVTVSTLQEIINVSELSTFTAVYNGIAQVMNADDPESVDYYVSYEAKVNAGIDFEDIDVDVDEDTFTVHITVPPVTLTDVNVDISSLDFIFYNEKANTSTVTEEAFKACEADVEKESQEQAAIYELAEQNAKNVLTALVRPIIDQSETEYSLVVE